MAGLPEDKPLLRSMGEKLSAFDGEVRAIQLVVDERGEVRDSASERLAGIRREIDSCQRLVREVVYGFVRRGEVTGLLQSTQVQLHEDRYVLPVRAEHRGRLAGVVHRASHTGATIFVEPAECVELNNRLVKVPLLEARQGGLHLAAGVLPRRHCG
jgi:DNA mismatch repair protein MutS2